MDLEIVYHIENASQFWAELHEILGVGSKEQLSRIDNALKTFVAFCTQYHELYLQTSLQLEHACSMLLDSEIFSWHSERLSEILLQTAANDTNPHCELIVHSTLLMYGRRNPAFLRSKQKWRVVFPILMDHVLVEMDDDFGGNVDLGRGPTNTSGLGVPIEARLRSLAIGILYEACRVQRFDADDLRIFDETFIERLFDLVELTRDVDDESLNYSVIKLIIALNEQFMVAAMPAPAVDPHSGKRKKERKSITNRILDVLMRRLHSSKTFGENIIFMLNRASNTEEDLVMQLLLLKILYLLFTTPGTQEYFYTNDLRVLVDVFLRELVDLPEESEALRHTYLRVLNPLLTNTQLRDAPYKSLLIRRTLQSLVSQSNISEVTPTTRRLVERCLNADWCRQLPPEPDVHVPPLLTPGLSTTNYSAHHANSAMNLPINGMASEDALEPPKAPFAFKTLQKSFSAETLQAAAPSPSQSLVGDSGASTSTSKRKNSIKGRTSKPPASGHKQEASFDLMPETPRYRQPPPIPDNALKSHLGYASAPSRKDSSDSIALDQITLPPPTRTNGTSPKSPRRPSLSNTDLPRVRKVPPPVPSLDRTSLDSNVPSKTKGIVPPPVHRREPPAIPSKSKKPKSSGNISDSPLSKLAYSATTAAR